MPDLLMRAQATISMASGLPEDAVVNTFHFRVSDTGGYVGAATKMDSALQAFYGAIQQYFPHTVGTTITYRYYDMQDPQPRILRGESVFAIVPGAANPLPHEVAACVSFACDPEPGIHPSSLRGRVFIGPLAFLGASSSNGRLDATFQDALRDAGAELADGNSGNCILSIYSATRDSTPGQQTDDEFRQVTHGWVDNAFDTQRRRGVASTSRLTWAI